MSHEQKDKHQQKDQTSSGWIKWVVWGSLVLVGTGLLVIITGYYYSTHLWKVQIRKAKKRGIPISASALQSKYEEWAPKQKDYSTFSVPSHLKELRENMVQERSNHVKSLKIKSYELKTSSGASWSERKEVGRRILSQFQKHQPEMRSFLKEEIYPARINFQKGPAADFSHLGERVDEAKLLTTYGKACFLRNRFDIVQEVIRTLFELSKAVMREPRLISFLTGITIEQYAFRLVEFCLLTGDPEFKMNQITALQNNLRDLNEERNMIRAMNGELYNIVHSVRRLRGEGGGGDSDSSKGERKQSDEPVLGFLMGSYWGANAVQFWMKVIDGIKRPYYRSNTRLKNLKDRLQAIGKGYITRYFHYLTLKLTPAFTDFRIETDRSQASYDLLRIALRMKKSQLQFGTVKEVDLSKTVDPFSGSPYRTTETENKVVLYSVGANGKDDGGINRDNSPADDITVRIPK